MWDIVFQLFTIVLIVLFVVSLTLFIRRLLVNSVMKNNQLKEMDKKLDKIIEYLDMDHNKR